MIRIVPIICQTEIEITYFFPLSSSLIREEEFWLWEQGRRSQNSDRRTQGFAQPWGQTTTKPPTLRHFCYLSLLFPLALRWGVCMHMMQVNVRAVGHFSQFCVCVYVCVCPPCYEWAAYQSWSKEHSQQCQACSHHYEQQEHYERMLLAHTVVGLIKPIWGPGPNVLTPSSSSISFTKLPCPFEEVALPPYCLLPHGSGSWKGGRGERETGGGRGDGHCWDVGSFHHRRTVAPLHSPAVVVPVEDHAASSPDPPTLPAAPPLQSPSGGDNWELCWSQRQSALTRGVARQHWGVSAASSSFSSCQHVEAVNEGKNRDWELFRVREKSGREVEARGRETQLWGRGGRKRRCSGRKRARGGIKGGYNPTLWVNAEFKKSEKTQTWPMGKIKFEDLWHTCTPRNFFFHPSAFLLFVSSQWRQTELHLNARPVETGLCSRRWTGEFRIMQRLNETAQLRHGWMLLG